MTRREEPRPSLLRRTPVAEWTAAATGLALTLGVVAYLVWEALAGSGPSPVLIVTSEPARATDGGHVVPVTVRNESRATAAAVEIRGVLEQAGRPVEERRAVLAYVPGRGGARGGLVFQRNPADYELRVAAEGYESP